jgi:predicted O-methyltransferase YrrM
MNSLLRTVTPRPVRRLARRIPGERRVRFLAEWNELRQLPRAVCPPVRARSSLDLQAVLRAGDAEAWERVSGCIEAVGLTHNLDGVNPGDRRALAALVASLGPENVLETGTHVGSSTTAIAAALAPSGSTITTVDVIDVNDPVTRHWDRYGAQQSPAESVKGLAPVRFVVGSSLDYLADDERSYDFIFLDGDHAAATVYREVPLALSRLRDGGVIMLHDYFPDARPLWKDGAAIPGPYLAIKRLTQEGCPISVLPLGQLPWPTKLDSNVTSLALVLGR